MTLRHYGRALAAATGAALLCASLTAPSLAAPTSDTDDAALTTASAIDDESAPISVVATRTDTVGDTVYAGDVVTVTFTYTNNTDAALTVFPTASNLSGVLTTGAPNCRWHNLAAHMTKSCTSATHTVTAEDVAAGTFTPSATWAATRDRNGTDVIAGDFVAATDPIPVAAGTRPAAPDPLETPQD
ncbi:MAG: sialidase, partial [Pauljensenia sp.]